MFACILGVLIGFPLQVRQVEKQKSYFASVDDYELAGLASQNANDKNADDDGAMDWDHQPWTEEEIRELIKPSPMSGAEIAARLEQSEPIAFIDPEITDRVEWVAAQRRKESGRLSPNRNSEA